MKVRHKMLDVRFEILDWKCLIVMLLVSCQKQTEIQPAFYHWQTNLSLTPMEQNYLDSLKINILYAKFFDVVWDASRDTPIPVAEIGGFEDGKIGGLQIVPCIFITNETFQKIDDEKIDWLSAQVSEKLAMLWQQMPPQMMTEVQFDCDWTATTRDRFFRFIEYFKAQNPGISISATIRLHQIRNYQQTGVPPVARGMLMFYNTGDLEDWYEENSILNIEIAKNYLPSAATNIKYPIPLDVALPVFAWGVLFRNGRMIRLINNLRTKDLSDTTRFLKIADNRFEVVKSTYLDGYYLYENDQLRLEAVDRSRLLKAAELLASRLKNRNLTVAFYHLDTTTIKYFPYEVLEEVCEKFEN